MVGAHDDVKSQSVLLDYDSGLSQSSPRRVLQYTITATECRVVTVLLVLTTLVPVGTSQYRAEYRVWTVYGDVTDYSHHY